MTVEALLGVLILDTPVEVQGASRPGWGMLLQTRPRIARPEIDSPARPDRRPHADESLRNNRTNPRR